MHVKEFAVISSILDDFFFIHFAPFLIRPKADKKWPQPLKGAKPTAFV